MSGDMQLVSGVLQAVLLAVLPVLAGVAVKWLLEKVKGEVQKLDKDQLATLQWVAGIAVAAAEQARLAGLVHDKKVYAVSIIDAWLQARGIQIDVALIDAAIEASVFDQFNASKTLPKSGG